MGSGTEKGWTAILKDVQSMVQHYGAAEGSDVDPVAAASAIHNSIQVHMTRLGQEPPYPRAAWKKLVAEMKVGWHSGREGCSAMPPHSKA